MDALARDGLRFTRMFPEAMPTVPARNSILLGRRIFPFRGWHSPPGHGQGAGLVAGARPRRRLHQRAAPPRLLDRLRDRQPVPGLRPRLHPAATQLRPLRRAAAARRAARAGASRSASCATGCTPRSRTRESRERLRKFLGNANDYAHDERRSFAARVFRDATALLDVARRNRPFCDGDRHLRAPRAVDAAAQVHQPLRRSRLPRPRAVQALLRAGVALPERRPGRGRCCGRMRALYAAEVTMTDRWLGVFLDRLHKLRLDRDTIVVLTSDHGFLLGDHGWTGKSPTQLHPALTRVPLTIVHPDGQAPRRLHPLLRPEPRHRAHDPVDGGRAGAAAMNGHRPLSALPRAAAEQALLRLRGLHQRLLHPHRPLGAVRQQPRAQPAPVRPRARSARAAQRGVDPSRQGAPALPGGARRAGGRLPYYRNVG